MDYSVENQLLFNYDIVLKLHLKEIAYILQSRTSPKKKKMKPSLITGGQCLLL